YTNHIEQCLHVTQGMSLEPIAATLSQADSALWVAVGGARELHPHIRKVHTGAARIALQAARDGLPVILAPLHLSFEAHCQFRSEVVVEIGEPFPVQGLDPDSALGREQVRATTASLKERLLPLTNWTPAADQDFGKKGWRGAGETRQALAEWYQVRVVDSLICLQRLARSSDSPLRWPERVRRLRAALRDSEAAKDSARRFSEAFKGFAEVAGRPFAKALPSVQTYSNFRVVMTCDAWFPIRPGTYWDCPIALKAIPRMNPAAESMSLPALRNFAYGPYQHPGLRIKETAGTPTNMQPETGGSWKIIPCELVAG
ncbi:unnamed protein product, partial [Effrenium voratum]